MLARRIAISLPVAILAAAAAAAQDPASAPPVPQSPWLRVTALAGETALGPRERHEGMPTRLLILDDGAFYVSGAREILHGRLGARELADLRARVDDAWEWLGAIRTGLPNALAFSDGAPRYDVEILGARRIKVRWSGDPDLRTPEQGALADLSARLVRFRHASMQRFRPAEFRARAFEETLAGGCRSLRGLPPVAALLAPGGVVVSAATAASWPRGVDVAQVCDGPRRYSIVLQPLLPGESTP
jgi:hypothetical protein